MATSRHDMNGPGLEPIDDDAIPPAPLVSVVIPTLNRCRTLVETIASVRGQDVDFPIEIVVIDNASTDDTQVTLAGPPYDDIRYIRHDVRLPRIANFMFAYQVARGRYVSILYDDEIMLQGNLREKARILDEHPEVVAVSSSVTIRDPATGQLTAGVAIRPRVTIENRPTYLRRAFDFTTGGLPPLMIRRQVFDQLSLDERDDPLDDNAFTLNLSRLGDMAHLPGGYVSDTAGAGEATGNGILEAITSRAQPTMKINVPSVWLYWSLYRIRTEHLLRSPDLSARDQAALARRSRRALRVGVWKAIYFRLVACQSPGHQALTVLRQAAQLSPRLLIPPIWSFGRWKLQNSPAPVPPLAHVPARASAPADLPA